ncbi:hypothetical protein PO909_018576 [Leuciscus waleckii]
MQWSDSCFKDCLSSVLKPSTHRTCRHPSKSLSRIQVNTYSVESPETESKTEIPPEYRAFQDVFSKRLATRLPPHQPWDCAIDLLPGATPLKGKVYPLSIPEQKAIFFFVAKKDGGLRQCIDYRALNTQSVKFSYPLPLVPAVLEQLHGAHIFSDWYMNEVFLEYKDYKDDILIYSRNMAEHGQHVTQVLKKLREHHLYLKLEKCEFHTPSIQFLGYIIDQQGIQMDQRKVDTIHNWPQPVTIKELQHFLGFANFYRRFIQNYSLLSSPLTSLLRNQPMSMSWNPLATEAFQRLKNAFITAPIPEQQM